MTDPGHRPQRSRAASERDATPHRPRWAWGNPMRHPGASAEIDG